MYISQQEQENLIAEMNEKLKAIKTYGELLELEKEYEEKISFRLRQRKSIRRKETLYLNSHFASREDYRGRYTEEEKENDTNVTYICDGDDCVRECLVANFWRNVEFCKW